jgi:hypothetical protein
MNLLKDYLVKSSSSDSKVALPQFELTEVSNDGIRSIKPKNPKLQKAILATINKTGLGYSDLAVDLAARGYSLSLATLHNIATNPYISFRKYDTDELCVILSDIKSNCHTRTALAWIDRQVVQNTVSNWLNNPKLIALADVKGQKTTVLLRDLLGFKNDRLIFSQWKNGRYKVKGERWEKAIRKMRLVLRDNE